MHESIVDRSIALGRKWITVARLVVGLIAGALVVANAIDSFSSDDSSAGPGAAVKVEIARFLSSIVLGAGLLTAVLLISVFASVYVERLAVQLQRPQTGNAADTPVATNIMADDSLWQR
jgi:hypothetical protein